MDEWTELSPRKSQSVARDVAMGLRFSAKTTSASIYFGAVFTALHKLAPGEDRFRVLLSPTGTRLRLDLNPDGPFKMTRMMKGSGRLTLPAPDGVDILRGLGKLEVIECTHKILECSPFSMAINLPDWWASPSKVLAKAKTAGGQPVTARRAEPILPIARRPDLRDGKAANRTASIAGDPPPGRSALDKKRAGG